MTDDDRTVAPIPDPDATIVTPRGSVHDADDATLPAFAARPASPAAVRSSLGQDAAENTGSGLNPLVRAANPILNVVHALRNAPAQIPPPAMQARLLEAIDAFEQRARTKDIPRNKVIAARFVLCELLDEVIAGTPWGSPPAWTEPRLLHQLHSEERGGERVFELLARLGEDPTANTDLLELFHVSLALGLEGRYRNAPNGRAQLDAVTQRVFELVRATRRDGAAAAHPRLLAEHWQGISIPPRPIVSVLPLGAVCMLGLASVLAAYLYLNRQVSSSAAPLFRQIHAVTKAFAAPALNAVQGDVARLRPAFTEAAQSGTLDLREDALRSVIALATDAVFVPGTAQLEAHVRPLAGRIAAALGPRAGQILIVGHTDNTPINTVRFPSNWHLSRDRAAAIAKALEQAGLPTARMRVEGRGDADPIAPNDSPDGRARNRRVEVQLVLPRPES